MKNPWKGRIVKYFAAVLFCALMVWVYIGNHDFASLSQLEKYRILCDAFTVPGLLLILIGLLVWISNQGALDGISYAVRGLFRVFVPGAGFRQNLETYYDYLKRKEEKRVKGYGFLFLVGGISLAIALMFYFLFYSVFYSIYK